MIPAEPIPVPPPSERSHADRAARVERVVAGTVARRHAGERVSDARVIADHPELSPELADALRVAADVRRAYLAARRSGSTGGEALAVLSDDELDAPLGELATVDVATSVPEADGYEIGSALLGGAQAAVYLARQVKTGRRVVVKVLTDGRHAHPRLRQRFEQEAEVLGTLDHPHLVSVIDTGHTSDEAPFLVMPYVDGQQLDEYWATLPALGGIGGCDAGPVLALFEKLARAVDAAHLAGVIHRDLKPSNIRIDRHGEPRVLDFGLARLVSAIDGTIDGMSARALTGERVVGTPAWMSPEQAAGSGDSIDGRTDIYALGLMLYHALAGRSPYPEEAPPERLLSHLLGTVPTQPSRSPTARRGLDRRIDAIVMKCLAKNRADRYETAAALADDLAKCQAGGEPLALVDYSRLRPSRPGRLGMWTWAVAAATVAVAAAVWEGFGLGLLGPGKSIFMPPAQTTAAGARVSRAPAKRQRTYRNGCADLILAEVSPSAFISGHPEPHQPALVVIGRPFFIGVTEVTRLQFATVMGLPARDLAAGEHQLPVANVTRAEAEAFCRLLSLTDGRRYRLPTVGEWELATRVNHSGEDDEGPQMAAITTSGLGWNAENSGGQVHRTREKAASRLGLWDMNGNVAEWCEDDGTDRSWSVACGGAYDLPVERCTNASRETVPSDVRRPDIGFRVVMEADGKGPVEK